MGMRIAGVVVTGIVGLFVVGCGDDEEATTGEGAATEAAPLSEQEFLAQGNEICGKGDQEIDQAASEVFKPGERPSRQDEQQFQETLVSSVQDQIDQIDALTPAEGLQEDVDQLLSEAQQAAEKLEQEPLPAPGQGPDPFAKANRIAKDIGLDACAG